MSDATRTARAMGEAAGRRALASGIPQRMPFKAPHDKKTPPKLAAVRDAWNAGYVTAAYPKPVHPVGKPHGLPDPSGQTDAMTAAAVTRDTRLYGEAFAAFNDETILAAASGNTGACLMAFLSAADGARIAVPDGDPAEEMHVTLAYLAAPAATYTLEQRGQIEAAISGAAGTSVPVAADGFAVALFNPASDEREPCVTLLVQSADLAALHDALTDAITAVTDLDDTFPIWVPHVTIGYSLDPAQIDAENTVGQLSFDRLVMAWGDDQTDLTSTAPTEEPVTDTLAAAAPPPATDEATPAPAPVDAADPAMDLTPLPNARTWAGPLGLVGTPSSDNRQLKPGGGTVRPLPQAISWQESSEDGHRGSVIVGRILSCEERNGQLWGTGDYLDPWENENVRKAIAQVDAGLGLISLDTAPGQISFLDATTGQEIDPSWEMDQDNIIVQFDAYEIGGATIVGFPAFADARIQNDPPAEETNDDVGMPMLPAEMMPGDFAGANPEGPTISADGTTITLTDGSAVGVGDSVSVPSDDGTTAVGSITDIDAEGQTVTVSIAATDAPDGGVPAEPTTVTVPISDLTPGGADQRPDAEKAPPGSMSAELEEELLVASSFTKPYTAAFFAKRELLGPTPVHVDEETREVYGHLGAFNECHVGIIEETGVCTTVPLNDDFSRFHLTPIKTDDGYVDVGRLTVGTGHYMKQAGGFRGALAHYDNTGSQVAIVRAYYDEWGVQITGQLIHDVAPSKIDELRRSPLSGDWRGRKDALKLTAALAVNVPGFPVIKMSPKIGMSHGEQTSLVAAGIVYADENTDVLLPSGTRIPRTDWESMVAASYEAFNRPKAVMVAAAASGLSSADRDVLLRQRVLRAKLALAGRR